MKTYLITVALLISLSTSLFSQSISEVNFLKLFKYATQDEAQKINEALIFISPNWRLNKSQSSSSTLKWEYKLTASSSPSAEFYLTAIKADGVEFNKIVYVFLSEELFKRYGGSVLGLDDCEIVYANTEKNGEKKTIFQTPHTVFIFRDIPITRVVEGKTIYKSYSVEMHPSVN